MNKIKQIEEENAKLRAALAAVVDACEDKNGQFRNWHNHLRSTTKSAKIILETTTKPAKIILETKV